MSLCYLLLLWGLILRVVLVLIVALLSFVAIAVCTARPAARSGARYRARSIGRTRPRWRDCRSLRTASWCCYSLRVGSQPAAAVAVDLDCSSKPADCLDSAGCRRGKCFVVRRTLLLLVYVLLLGDLAIPNVLPGVHTDVTPEILKVVSLNCINLKKFMLFDVDSENMQGTNLWEKLGSSLTLLQLSFVMDGKEELEKIGEHCRKLTYIDIDIHRM